MRFSPDNEVPSWSCASIEQIGATPVVHPFIGSLKVRLNESPTSRKSELPRLLTTRASTIVGGVKSPAPVVKITVAGQASGLPTTSVMSVVLLQATVTVYCLSAGIAMLVVSLNVDVAVVAELRRPAVPSAWSRRTHHWASES